MLFFVKNKMFLEKQGALMEKIQSGEVKGPANYAKIYCSEHEPGVGYSIFDVESESLFNEIMDGLKPYSETYEVTKILTLEQFMQKMASKS